MFDVHLRAPPEIDACAGSLNVLLSLAMPGRRAALTSL